ncbi:MAG: hypothetical protein AMJ46_04005 [Latescibacteria bacterium DG_63]|nr:MAG: hypothetical protein AMJ46_04005 [Latescibacteria bacterium DG_63]
MRRLKIIEAAALLVFTSTLGVSTCALAAWHADGNPVCTAGVGEFDCAIAPDNSGGGIFAWLDMRSGNQDVYAQRVSSLGGVLWDTSGVPICTASGAQDNFRLISDGAGGAIITWADYRSSLNFDVYAQRVSPSGNVLWGANGIAICTAFWDQDRPAIVSDGAGGAIIVWQDYRGGIYGDIYAQRVDPLGNVLWGANGVAICTAAYDQQLPDITSDGAGGAIIGWSDQRSATHPDIYAQRVDAWGVVQWTPDGIAICTAAQEQLGPLVISDAAGGAIISWIDYRNSSNFDIYSQRINAGGVVQWGVNGTSVCMAADHQYLAGMLPDGAGGAIISWNDFRNGMDSDLYAQRVNAVGVWQWTTDGIAICVASGDQGVTFHAPVASDGTGGAIFVWEDSRSMDSDVYSQRVDASGTIQWTANGVLACTSTDDQHAPVIMGDGAGGVIIGWEDQRGGADGIYAQYLNPYGEWHVAPEIAFVCDVPHDQGGYVSLAWDRSSNDVWPRQIVTHYSVWRAVPPEVLLSMPGSVELVSGSDIVEEFSGPAFRVTTYGTTDQYWEWVATIGAHYLSSYGHTASMLFDSTSASSGYHTFFVSAHTADPFVFWDSDPDSGYSVDNLSPDPPEELAGDYSYPPAELMITWAPNSEADLSHYAVYKGDHEGFVPDVSNCLGAPEDTFFVDSSFDPNVDNYYKVSAWDIHENESGYSLLRPDEITGVSGSPDVPSVTLLEQNVPNPFNPVTVIRFSLAEAGRTALRVYDVGGRPIRALVDEPLGARRYEVVWDGRDDGGALVASGIYIYQLEAAGYTEARKMVLLR